MEHACYKCGHTVEDGRPFCVQCGAPQIRVILPEPSTQPAGAGSSGNPVFPSESSRTLNPDVLSPVIVWPVAIRACAIAALIAALFMAFGLMVPLLAVLGAGFLGVSLYHRKNPAWLVNARSGAKLGAACGVLFFAFAGVIESVAVAVFHTEGEVRNKLLEALQQAATRSNDPQVQAAFEKLRTPEGLALMMVFGIIFLLLLSIAAGSLSGALTGAFFGRKKRS
jgi:hypothetical protein